MHRVQQPRRSFAIRRQLMEIYTQMLLWNAHQRYAYFPLQGSVPAITAVCVGDTLFKGMQNEGYQAVKGCRPSSFTFVFQVCGRNHGNGGDAASLPHFCHFALRNLTIKNCFLLSISANSTFILVRLLANVSGLVPRPGDVGRAPRIPAQCFKPRRSLCFGSSDQLDSTASAAFISGSKVMADGQSLDWLQLLTRMCFASPRPASDTNRSKRVKMFVGFWC